MKEYRKYAKEMLEFIEKSPCSFHAIANISKQLNEAGFTEVSETDEWNLMLESHPYATAITDAALRTS